MPESAPSSREEPPRRSEKLSAVDTAWLRMDRPANLMMICGVLLLGDRLSLARLRSVVRERFLRFPRFLQYPVQTSGGAYWQDASPFDLHQHVRTIRLPGKGTPALQSLVSRLAATPLGADRPLWQFDLVEQYGRGSAIIIRFHHCYADGIALIQVMLSMTDTARDGTPASKAKPERESLWERWQEDALAWMPEPVASAMQNAVRLGTTAVEKSAELMQDPGKFVAFAQQGTSLIPEIAKLALMSEDAPSRFKGKPVGDKRVAWAPSLPLDEVKAIGKALHASVNDVLLACVAGAMGHYLAKRGDKVDGLVMRALVPVNLRSDGDAIRLGNAFGLVFLDLPIGIDNPVARVYAVRENMRALRGSMQPVLALGLLAAMGAGPRMLQDQLLDALARKATAVMTNVPGPQRTLYLGGARIDSLMFWVPQSGDIGIGASILSYDGRVQFGLITDRALCEDPERIVNRFRLEFEHLVLAGLLAPWPRDGDLDPDAVEAAVRADARAIAAG